MSLSRRAGRAGGRAEPSRAEARVQARDSSTRNKPNRVLCSNPTARTEEVPNRGGPEPSRTEGRARAKKKFQKCKNREPVQAQRASRFCYCYSIRCWIAMHTDAGTEFAGDFTGADPPLSHAHTPRSRRIGGSRTVGGPMRHIGGCFENIYLHHGPDVRGTRSLFHIFNPSLSVCPYVRVRRSVGPSVRRPVSFRGERAKRGAGVIRCEVKSINHSSDRECATRSVSGETDETDETDEIPREEIRRDGRGMETVARNVAGGIARGLSDANGGGAARGKRDVSGEVRSRRRERRRDRRDRRRAGILPVNFFFEARARAIAGSSTDDVKRRTTSVGRRSGAPERRRRVSWMILLEVSLTNRRFVTRDFKPTEENQNPSRRVGRMRERAFSTNLIGTDEATRPRSEDDAKRRRGRK